MSKYIKKLPTEPSFEQQGLKGYNFDLECKDITLSYEDVFKGHDKYDRNYYSSKIYYVLEGEGTFCVDNEKMAVKKGDVVEVPKGSNFVFAGKMKLLLIMSPGFRPQDDIQGEENDLY